jgi:Ca2+-binding EF-hand superfamily protein
MSKKTILSLAVVTVLAVDVSAWAQPQGSGRAAELFARADVNKDGKVTFEELKVVLPGITPARYKQLDRNGDGVLTKEDRAAQGTPGNAGAGSMLAKLKQADTNGDQKITFEEAKAAFPKITQERFKQLDRNGDGVLTREDFRQALVEKIKQADKNGDGKVSFEEAQAAFPRITMERFRQLDRNGDGFLSPEDRNQ